MTGDDRVPKRNSGELDGSSSSGEDDSLMSPRTLVITAVSIVVALIAGLAAGIPAGMSLAQTAGSWLAIAVGVLSGLAAACLAGLTTAGTLHALISKRWAGGGT